MFHLLALLSAAGYALQSVLLVPYARNMDTLSLAFYRGVAFPVTLLPLLLGASSGELFAVLREWDMLLLGGIGGGFSLTFAYAAYRFVPVGVAHALQRSVTTILLAAVAWTFWEENLSPAAVLCIALIIAAGVFLGTRKHAMPHLDERGLLGLLLVLLSAFSFVLANVAFITLSRSASPLVGGYFWEAAIAAATVVLLALRRGAGGRSLERISLRSFGAIALRSWPTLLGTGCFGLAVRLGPVAVLGAVGTVSLAFTALLAHWLYGEKLRPAQWLSIAAVIAGILGLRFA
ncbi:MAG: DMT family transporter [Candidatus Peribacteraceae bacterium]|nr:DMT family transporter [Candidatus Peribacteraceae bacterium]